jgi:DNA-directed RNA polymerase subunit RPC12/RpoP
MSERDSSGAVEYRPIAGFPLYEVGSDGSVWSRYRGPWYRLKPYVDSDGYHAVRVYNNARWRYARVHHLVLETFVGPCPDGMEGCHYPDRDRANNAVVNLRWDFHRNNIEDKREHGTWQFGESHGGHILTEGQAAAIIAMKGKASTVEVAAQFPPISRVTVQAIWDGRLWKHLPRESLPNPLCKTCGNEFEPPEGKRLMVKYCSKRCMYKFFNDRRAAAKRESQAADKLFRLQINQPPPCQ